MIQDLWNTVGFKVTVDPLDTVPWREARSQGTYPAAIQGHTFRYDPDDYFARNLHSKSDYSNVLSGWQNAKYDGLVEEAKRTLDSGPAQGVVHRGLEHRQRRVAVLLPA